jgi:hypothetical protein
MRTITFGGGKKKLDEGNKGINDAGPNLTQLEHDVRRKSDTFEAQILHEEKHGLHFDVVGKRGPALSEQRLQHATRVVNRKGDSAPNHV